MKAVTTGRKLLFAIATKRNLNYFLERHPVYDHIEKPRGTFEGTLKLRFPRLADVCSKLVRRSPANRHSRIFLFLFYREDVPHTDPT